jgi:hypothetical protein
MVLFREEDRIKGFHPNHPHLLLVLAKEVITPKVDRMGPGTIVKGILTRERALKDSSSSRLLHSSTRGIRKDSIRWHHPRNWYPHRTWVLTGLHHRKMRRNRESRMGHTTETKGEVPIHLTHHRRMRVLALQGNVGISSSHNNNNPTPIRLSRSEVLQLLKSSLRTILCIMLPSPLTSRSSRGVDSIILVRESTFLRWQSSLLTLHVFLSFSNRLRSPILRNRQSSQWAIEALNEILTTV